MKNAISRAVIAFTILLTAGALTSEMSQANYFPPPSIEIFSPISAPDVNSNANVTLNVRVNVLPSKPDITSILYSLDGKVNVTLVNLTKEDNVYYWTTTKGVFAQGKAFSVAASLDNLTDGNHSLAVYAYYADGNEMSRSYAFIVDSNCVGWKPPALLLLSPLNQTYATNQLPLTFAVNGTLQSASYVLDNQAGNWTSPITGNATLTELSDGMHKLTVTVRTDGGVASQSVFFSVVQELNTQQQPFETSLALVALATLLIAAVVYLKKRRR